MNRSIFSIHNHKLSINSQSPLINIKAHINDQFHDTQYPTEDLGGGSHETHITV